MTSPRILLAAGGLRARKHLGQNFLADPAVADRIAAAAAIGPGETVLEIGAGLGALTLPCAARAERVIAVEKDRGVAALLRNELAVHRAANVAVLCEDILRVRIAVLAAGRRLVVMGNLPYNISSQVIVRLLRERGAVDRAVIMLQRELAARLLAGPGSREYGRLSVLLQYAADLESVLRVPASGFFPRPQVDSEVLSVRFRPPAEPKAADEGLLFAVVKAAFGQRRKTLRNALAGSPLPLDAPRAAALLATAEIDPARRAETLTVAEFVRLTNRAAEIPGFENADPVVPPP